MKLYNLNGRLISKNVERFRIKWDKKERSNFQTEVKQFLKPYLITHIVYSEFPLFSSLLKFDIFDYTTKVAYEISGRQHTEFVPHFHKNKSAYLGQIKRDFKKIDFCEKNNIILVEIYPEDLPLSKEWFEKFNVFL